ncbi:MAG: hypothetical protein V2I97_05485 [Desulfococcaceae bacterium]|jgi:hypothetical protein|nr:hypothetical protein [Desulfococcaceae bacterium]
MKFLPFRSLIPAILLPPLLYIFSVEMIQKIYIDGYLEEKYLTRIEEIAIGNPQSLFNGTARLKDRIRENIRDYLNDHPAVWLGLRLRIAVLTKKGSVLYPPLIETDDDFLARHADYIQIAAENLKLMEEGLLFKGDLIIEYNSLISVLLLLFYITLSLCFLSYFYRKGSRKALLEAEEKNTEIQRLSEQEKQHSDRLRQLGEERSRLRDEFARIRDTLEEEKAKALRNEDELVREIIALEEKLQKNLAHQEEQQAEIDILREQLELLDKEKGKGDPPRKEVNLVQKRFKTLYKNLSFSKKAVQGFASLEDDLKIKCEELVHLLNDNPELVTIKRKVFGKKGRQTVLEVVFAYKGRLYFRKNKEGRIEILTVGTKNSQGKDLEYLNSL